MSGTNIGFTNNSSGGNAYQWTFGTGTGAPSSSTAVNPTVSFNPSVGSGSTAYSVKLLVTASNGCKDSVINNVTIKRKPGVSLDTNHTNWDQSLAMFVNCGPNLSSPNFSFTVDNTSSTSSTNTSYLINWGDNSSNTLSSSFTSTTHNYTTIGLFNVIVTAFDSNSGCNNQIVYQLFSGSSPATNAFGGPAGPVNLCNPTTINFSVDTSKTNQDPPGTIYTFFVNDSSNARYFTKATLPNTIAHTFTKTSCGTNSNLGSLFVNSFYAQFESRNPCGFSNIFVNPITVIRNIIANFTAIDSIVCSNRDTVICTNLSSGTFFNTSNNNCNSNFQRFWTISPGVSGVDWVLTSGSQTSLHISVKFLIPGSYNIKLKITPPLNTGNPPTACNADSITKTICVQASSNSFVFICSNSGIAVHSRYY
jgi:hypothetical protein